MSIATKLLSTTPIVSSRHNHLYYVCDRTSSQPIYNTRCIFLCSTSAFTSSVNVLISATFSGSDNASAPLVISSALRGVRCLRVLGVVCSIMFIGFYCEGNDYLASGCFSKSASISIGSIVEDLRQNFLPYCSMILVH